MFLTKTKLTIRRLTRPLSSSLVSITIVNVLCSQIIRQKSLTVSEVGPDKETNKQRQQVL